MTLRLTFGIDPGITGALAVLADGAYCDVIDLPTCGHRKTRWIDSAKLAAQLRGYRAAHPGADVLAVVESVHAMPGQGVTSMFGFGRSCGIIDGVLGALGIRAEYVTPQAWKRAHGLIGSHKDASRVMAATRYPTASLSRKRDCGRADALLMASAGVGG